MSPARISFHPEALRDIAEARLWYADAGERIVERFATELQNALERVEASPEAWSRYLAGTRAFPVRRFPYFVVYEIGPDGPHVVAVHHVKRGFGYLSKRLAST